jgi:hypothetical protein
LAALARRRSVVIAVGLAEDVDSTLALMKKYETLPMSLAMPAWCE